MMRWFPVFVCLVACGPVKGNVPDDGPLSDGPDEPTRELVVESRATPIRNVDVLVVIDDSGTMFDKQTTLANNFGKFVQALETIPGGLPDLHLGVITTDVGTKGSGNAMPADDIGAAGQGGCSGTGDGGNLTVGQATTITGNFVSDIKLPDGSRQRNYSDADLATVFGNMAKVGTFGCGFEQPLHAMRRALENNPQNPGFLRTDAILAVLFLTDEDDCSVRDPALFGPESATLGPLQSFRCTRFGVTCAVGGQTPNEMNQIGLKEQCAASTDDTLLDPVAPFHDFLVGLKADPSQVIVGGIIGTPTPVEVELVAPPGAGPPQPTLSHSCSNIVNGIDQPGDPGVRLKSFFDLFPNRNTFTSICQNDFTEAVEGTANLIAQTAGTPCISKPLVDIDTAAPGIQADCIVEDSLGTNVTIIAECDSSSTPTCWRLAKDAVTCPLFDNLRLEVVREGTIPPQTVTRARCIVQ